MKKYDWILFDADDTLFNFDAFNGLKILFARFDIHFTEADFAVFQSTNKPLWMAYQQGKISAEDLKHQRFLDWSKKLNVSTGELNQGFISTMADLAEPLTGAHNLLNALNGKVKMGIITNGFIAMQEKRLIKAGFNHHFDLLLTSEEVGVPKPHPDIFHCAFEIMDNPALETILMVGDSFEADIVGGINAGIDTCWLNHHDHALAGNIRPHFEVTSLAALQNLLGY